MRFALTCLAALALLAPGQTRAEDDHRETHGLRLAQAARPYPPPPPGMRAPPAPPPAAAPATAPPPPAAPVRVAPAPPPGGRYTTVPAPPPGAPPRPPGYYYGPGYYPHLPYYVSPWSYSVYMGAPWFWGWGWGYGYYPVYPEPPPPPDGAPPPNRVNAELSFTGGATDQRAFGDPARRIGPGASAGFSLRVESRGLGIHAGYDGFFTSHTVDFGSRTTLDYFTAHATWSFLAGQSGRLRLEAGVSALYWPTPSPYALAATAPYASVTSVGPDGGFSGQVSLVGPFGVEGYARWTPWPRMATDLYAGAALRLGPLALTGGWRDLRADGGDTAPSLRFAGPQFGLAVLF